MPYVICSACRVTTYSAALWSGTDECPSCGRHLPVPRTTRVRRGGSVVEVLDEPPTQGASPPAA